MCPNTAPLPLPELNARPSVLYEPVPQPLLTPCVNVFPYCAMIPLDLTGEPFACVHVIVLSAATVQLNK